MCLASEVRLGQNRIRLRKGGRPTLSGARNCVSEKKGTIAKHEVMVAHHHNTWRSYWEQVSGFV